MDRLKIYYYTKAKLKVDNEIDNTNKQQCKKVKTDKAGSVPLTHNFCEENQ